MKTAILSIHAQNYSPIHDNGIKSLIGEWWSSLKNKSTYKRDIKHLNSLSDERLRDIGIQRKDITSAVSGFSPRCY